MLKRLRLQPSFLRHFGWCHWAQGPNHRSQFFESRFTGKLWIFRALAWLFSISFL